MYYYTYLIKVQYLLYDVILLIRCLVIIMLSCSSILLITSIYYYYDVYSIILVWLLFVCYISFFFTIHLLVQYVKVITTLILLNGE